MDKYVILCIFFNNVRFNLVLIDGRENVKGFCKTYEYLMQIKKYKAILYRLISENTMQIF